MRSREDATELTTGVDGRDGILTAGICGDSTGSGSGSGWGDETRLRDDG